MSVDYKEKVRRLLALSKSPEEHEAKAALLKAQELMAKHKLTEADLEESQKQSVKDKITDITCSKRRDPWIINLSAVIAKNYCCMGYRRHEYGQQTQAIGFIGLEDDVEICVAIFKYAVDCVRSEIRRIKKENTGYSQRYISSLCNGYGYGFVRGISAALSEQQASQSGEWGLVLVLPEEVKKASQNFEKQKFVPKAQDEIDPEDYKRGYRDGTEFNPAKRLT